MTLSGSGADHRGASSWRDHLLHHAAGWGAALCALTPFLYGWTIPAGGRDWPVRFWPGHLLIDFVEIVLLTLLGLVSGGWWWWDAGWRRGWTGAAGAMGVLAAGIMGILGLLPPAVLAGIAAVWLLWGVAAGISFPRHRSTGVGSWLAERRSWNAAFFASFVLLNTVSDVLMAGNAPPGWLAAAGFVAGRFLTQLVLASALWLLLTLCARWSPPGAGWVGWTAVILTPLLVVLDMALRLMWTKSLLLLCAEIESGGRLDWLRIREGTAGLELSAGRMAAGAACVSLAPAWFFVCHRFSRRRGWRASGLQLAGVALTAWVCLMALQVIESAWKSGPWRHWESRASMLHLTPFSPARGMVTFRAAAADPVLSGPATAARRPDIYLFIVESMRADAIDPGRTPFLARWRDAECQPLHETRAASNATHLSWFSILHGRMPWWHENVRKRVEPAPLLSLLHAAGYRLEVRSAGNFDYGDMLRCNFGDCGIAAVMEHVPEGHPDRGIDITEREKRVMARLRNAVTQSPAGGVFRLTTVDSTHYPYRWHPEWKPPYGEYEEQPLWPVRPSPGEIERVRRRYWNSIAWCDHLLGEFVAHLRSVGRYDSAMIIVTGDHGEEFKEYGSWFHCSALNPPQTRVPILVKWPAESGRGPALGDASHLDIAPSILDAAGFPDSAWRKMSGRSLRRPEPATSIINTCYNSQDGITMIWRREGWEAAFSWSAPWTLAAPGTFWLERLEGPQGAVEFPAADAWEDELRRRFPDAFGRLFSRCERVAD